MLFYFSNPFMSGPQLEDITGEDGTEAMEVASKWNNAGLVDDLVIYLSY